MFNRGGIIHESVADVLAGLGVKKKPGKVNLANNAAFVAEGLKLPPGKGGKAVTAKPGATTTTKPVNEADVHDKDKENEDETDGIEGDKPATTKASNKKTGTKVLNTPADTECHNEKGVKNEAVEKASLTFYEKTVKQPILISIYEDMTAEVFGLTEEDLAPFGGKAPAVPQKYTEKKDKGNDDDKKPYIGNIMLYSVEGLDQKSQVLMGTNFKAAGWSTPAKGSGNPTVVNKGAAGT